MPTQAEIYGYGTLANILCCVCSLAGAVVFPCASKYKNAYHLVISVFMGLAVGTLGSGALLHLIPEALGVHGHEDEHNEVNETMHKKDEGKIIVVEPYVWFMIVTMAGVYGFYLLEMIMTFIQDKTVKKEVEPSTPVISAFTVTTGDSSSVTKLDESTFTNGTVEYKLNDDSEGHTTTGFTPLVIMIIVGDAVHNFADGLAIAASFSKSNIEGLSTAIAIFCHELPHELGDFAILLTSGMGFCKALLANLFSSLTALIGFYIGVPISTDETSRQWIFAVTAGMFLYISLVDIVPGNGITSIKKGQIYKLMDPLKCECGVDTFEPNVKNIFWLPQLTKQGSRSVKTFIYHNIGIVIGVLVIALLSVFEEHIVL